MHLHNIDINLLPPHCNTEHVALRSRHSVTQSALTCPGNVNADVAWRMSIPILVVAGSCGQCGVVAGSCGVTAEP